MRLMLLGYVSGGRQLEKELHDRFQASRIGRTEWFHAERIAEEIEAILGM